MTEVERIIEGLTKAQKAAFIEGVFFCQYRKKPCMRAHKTVRYNLCLMRLLHDYLGTPALTPLGLQVKAALEATNE